MFGSNSHRCCYCCWLPLPTLHFYKAGKEAKQANKPASITIIIIAILFWVRVSKRKYIGNICCLPRNHFAIIYGLSALPPENTFDIGAKEKNQQNILRAVFRVYDLIAFFASYTAYASAQTPMPSAQYEVKAIKVIVRERERAEASRSKGQENTSYVNHRVRSIDIRRRKTATQ